MSRSALYLTFAFAIVAALAGAIFYSRSPTRFPKQPPTIQNDDSPARRASNQFVEEGAKPENILNRISYCTKAIEADPKNPTAYFARGRAFFMESTAMNPGDEGRREKMNQAIADFEKCLELDSTSEDNYYAPANAYYFHGLALATRANWSVTEQTGDPAEELKDLETAHNDYAKALELRPKRLDLVKDADDKARRIYEDAKSKFQEEETKAAESKQPAEAQQPPEATPERPVNFSDPTDVANAYIEGLIMDGVVNEAKYLEVVPRPGPAGFVYVYYYLDYVTRFGFRREGRYGITLQRRSNGTYRIFGEFPGD